MIDKEKEKLERAGRMAVSSIIAFAITTAFAGGAAYVAYGAFGLLCVLAVAAGVVTTFALLMTFAMA